MIDEGAIATFGLMSPHQNGTGTKPLHERRNAMKPMWCLVMVTVFLAMFVACAEKQTEGEPKQVEQQPAPVETTAPVVHTTESGLQYSILKEGSGPKPLATDRVTVHYRGTLTDGTEFDSSYKRGQPATFSLESVIRGWTEGLQLMPVGSKFRFTIPPELAYGQRGAGQLIGPNETLVFEVELLDIVK
jgi:FKBP-type peptidyl-prolyl cis-trans isomerase